MQSTFNNSYNKYYQIIEEAQTLKRVKLKRNHPDYEYFENHHIIPDALGGSNSWRNMVLLTPEEHYVCHSLLCNFCEGASRSKMIYAWNLMNNTRDYVGKELIGKKEYGRLKREFSKTLSIVSTKFQAEINADPSRKESKRINSVKAQAEIKADPILLERRRKKQSESAIRASAEIAADPIRAASRSKNRSEAAIKFQAELNADPIRAASRSRNFSLSATKFQAEINADPIRRERRRINRLGVTDKAVIHLDENWNYLGRYSSIKKAAIQLGYLRPGGINHAVTGRAPSYKKQHWIYEKDYIINPEKAILKARKLSEAHGKAINQLNQEGEIIATFKSANTAGNKLKINPADIVKVLTGYQNSLENNKWKFKI